MAELICDKNMSADWMDKTDVYCHDPSGFNERESGAVRQKESTISFKE